MTAPIVPIAAPTDPKASIQSVVFGGEITPGSEFVFQLTHDGQRVRARSYLTSDNIGEGLRLGHQARGTSKISLFDQTDGIAERLLCPMQCTLGVADLAQDMVETLHRQRPNASPS
jgi:hypothetical protein